MIEIEKTKLTNTKPTPVRQQIFKEDLKPEVKCKEIKGCIKETAKRIEKVWFSTTRNTIVARVIDKEGKEDITPLVNLGIEPASIFVTFMSRLIMEEVEPPKAKTHRFYE